MIKPQKYSAKIINIIEVKDSLLEVSLNIDEKFTCIPGQFVNIFVGNGFKRPYSILDNKNGLLRVLVGVREPGIGSNYFKSLKKGEELSLFGPLGRFQMRETDSANIVYIAAGTGLVPFVSMINQSVKENVGKNHYLINGVRYFHIDPAKNYLDDLISSNQLEYKLCVSREEKRGVFKGRVTDYLKSEFEIDYSNTDFYICGVNQMVKDVREYLKARDAKNVFIENYG